MISNQPHLSLCMIVRDSAATIKPCLESISPWVDELIIVDTGSLDETPQIAQSFGAQVHYFPWCDDFSAARNESLRHARGEWLFWMDSDDTIPAPCGQQLRQTAYAQHDPRTLGYVAQVRCPSYEDDDGFTVVDHVKLFRNHPQLRFEFRIHEQLLPSIRRLGGEVEWTDVFVEHSGSDISLQGRQKKYERDLRILKLELADRPEHPFALFNFGMTYADMGEYQLSTEFLMRCLAASQPDESHLRKAYALLISSLMELKDSEKAWEMCVNARSLFPEDLELLFRQGILAHARGELALAVDCYRGALANNEDRHFSSIDEGIAGFKSRHNLALVYADMGRPDLAELQWRQVLEQRPRYAMAWRGLGKELVRQGRKVTAELVLEQMKQQDIASSEQAVVNAAILESEGSVDQACTCLRDALASDPSNEWLQQRLSRLLFESGSREEAIEFIREICQQRPADAANFQNLGVLLLNAGQTEQAAQALERARELRPTYLPTLEHLLSVYEQLGNTAPAQNCAIRNRATGQSILIYKIF